MQAVASPMPVTPRPLSGFPLSPGVQLGKFEIVRDLASGGMGKLYVAQDTLTGAAVALKVLIPAPEAEPGRLERFKRESLICQRLNHPNIIRIYDIGEDAGFYFISMELLDGDDLRAVLDEEPLPSLTRIAGLSLQVLAGLEFAHDQSIVHRDFKPQNIFVTRSGAVKLLDFGVAQALRISSHTTPGSMVGTPGYMSPEQAQGKPDLDGRADIYSWGVVLYEMLTGRLPFRGDSPIGVAAAHVYEAPPPIRELKPDLPIKLAALVMRCLEKNPGARYANVAELREAFVAAMRDAGAPIDAVSAAIANARTPTPGPVQAPGENAIITRIIPKRLREAIANDAARPQPKLKTLAKRLFAFALLGVSALIAKALWQPSYSCEAFQRIELGDFESVQASIAGAGSSRLGRACRIQAEAGLALANSHTQLASEKVRAALALEPKLVWATILSGDLAAQAGDLDGARRAYESATTANVGSDAERSLASARLARLALDRGDLDAAARHLDDASRYGSSIPEVHHLLAQLDMKRGDPKGAEAQYRKALEVAPGDGVAQVLLEDLRLQERNRADGERQRRVDDLMKQLGERWKEMKAGKAPSPSDNAAGAGPRTLTLLPFASTPAADMSRVGLGDALRIAMEQALSALPNTKVVDREVLDRVLSELLVGTSPLADPNTAPQLGKLLSARYILRPMLTRLDDTLTFNVRVIDVETSEIVASLSPEISAGAKVADVAAALGQAIEKQI